MANGSRIDEFGEVLNLNQRTSNIIDGRWIRDQRVRQSFEVQPKDI
jgi:hypothetical protein